MELRPVTPADYPVLCEWWKAHGWPPVPQAALPKTGLIVPGYAVAFLYSSDASITWLEWLLVNPAADKKERHGALTRVVKQLLFLARSRGYSHVYTSTNHAKLQNAMESWGFQVTDQKVSQLICPLGLQPQS